MHNCEKEIFEQAKIEDIDAYPAQDWQCDSRCNGVVSQLQQLEMTFANTKPNANQDVHLCFHTRTEMQKQKESSPP